MSVVSVNSTNNMFRPSAVAMPRPSRKLCEMLYFTEKNWPLPSIYTYTKNIKTALTLCNVYILRNNQPMSVYIGVMFLSI